MFLVKAGTHLRKVILQSGKQDPSHVGLCRVQYKYHTIEYASNKGMVIVLLPSHTSDKLKSLDVAVFGSFSIRMRGIHNDFSIMHPPVHVMEDMPLEFASKLY